MLQLSHDAIVKAANELPPLPRAARRITEIVSNPDYRIRDVVAAVELDSAIAGQLLLLANSPLYGSGKIGSVQEAVIRLGVGTVRSVVVSTSARPAGNLDLSAFGMTPESYWAHSVATLSFAEQMSVRKIAPFGPDFSTAALLHDYGKLVLARHLTETHVELLRERQHEQRSVDLEFQVLGVTHSEVTAIVLLGWSLPESMIKVVQHHHDPKACDTPTCHGLNLANQMAWRLHENFHALGQETESREHSMQVLGMTQDTFEATMKFGEERFEAIMEVFDTSSRAAS